MNAAEAEAERIRLIGDAEAQAMEAIGISDAERMRMKAAVYKKYGEAAILNIALNALPKVISNGIFDIDPRWKSVGCSNVANCLL